MLKKGKKDSKFSRRHRRHRRHRRKTVSSWDKHYNYESDTNSEIHKMNNNPDKHEVQAVHGLKDYLQGKKSTFK
jgi:hypothetical protein